MALIIKFVNKSNLAEISDYEVKVAVTEIDSDGSIGLHQIAGGEIYGHRRSDGWLALLEQFVREFKENNEA